VSDPPNGTLSRAFDFASVDGLVDFLLAADEYFARARLARACALRDLLLHEPDQLFVRGPKRLANAYRIVDFDEVGAGFEADLVEIAGAENRESMGFLHEAPPERNDSSAALDRARNKL
jgi:hypothetical protein